MSNIFEKIFSIKNERYHKVICILGVKFAFTVRDKEPYLRFIKNIGCVEHEIVHILTATKTSIDLVNFLNKHMDKNKHLFIFKDGPTLYTIRAEGENVIEGNLSTLKIDLTKTKKIIMHSLFRSQDTDFLYYNPQLLPITYWNIYGGDLYKEVESYKSKYVKTHIKAILTAHDEKEYNKRFGKKQCFEVIFPDDVFNKLELNKPRADKCINIMVNHCADLSTFEILKDLEKFKNENIKITTVLSYITMGQKGQLNKKIKSLGKDLFGEKFVPVEKWLASEEYVKFLSQQDIFILGMHRQQGLGNLRYCAALGSKLFMNRNIDTYKSLSKIGIKLYDTNSIRTMDFAEFINYSMEEMQNNRKIFKERVSDKNILKLWEKVFNA